MNPTILSGEVWTETLYWSLHVVTLVGNATLAGFMMTKGNANGDSSPYNVGAGIYCPVADKVLALTSCIVSATIREQVKTARIIQQQRFARAKTHTNSAMTSHQ